MTKSSREQFETPPEVRNLHVSPLVRATLGLVGYGEQLRLFDKVRLTLVSDTVVILRFPKHTSPG